jgi:hypothetical protein
MTAIVNQQENINNQTDLIKNANSVTGNFHAVKQKVEKFHRILIKPVHKTHRPQIEYNRVSVTY